jgi:hypothetical protein
MPILPKATYKYNAILIKIPMTLFIEIEKKVIKFKWDSQKYSESF